VADKLVVITGAASGIGAAIATYFKENKWQVAGIDLQDSDTDFSFKADVSNFEDVEAVVNEIEKEIGPIQAAISNAGHYEMKKITDVSDQELEKMFKVHLGGFRNIALNVLPGMRSRRAGSLICITSELGIGGGENVSHYSAAKGAQIGLVRSLAAEYAQFNIRINGVAPGPTDTPLIANDSPERSEDFIKSIPINRLVHPREIAHTVYFLASEGTFIVGEVISPNGGLII
jgi:NAD(P)-dependent dehydrogenase (short-subunit alcohol dehydrogenase family)